MRVLLTTIPGTGHFAKVVPLARAVVEAGHELRVASSASFQPTIERAGLAGVPAGLDWLESAPDRIAPALARANARQRSSAVGTIVSQVAPARMLQDLLRMAEAWRPDVVVSEPSEWGGLLAAERLRTPHALLATRIPFVVPTWQSRPPSPARATGPAAIPYSELRRRLGLASPDAPHHVLARRYLVLDGTPPSFHPADRVLHARTAHAVRLVPWSAPDPDGSPWLDRLPTDRPVVHVNIGTVFDRDPPAAATTARAAIAEGAYVVVAHAGPAAELGPLPDGVLVVRWAPHDLLLPRCSAVVHRGGWGTTLLTVAHRRPALVVPHGADQPLVAARLQACGAGRSLPVGPVDEDAARRELRRLLDDVLLRRNAARIGDELATMPGPEHGVVLLERLVETGRPIAGRPDLPGVW
ncbi:MAG: glycosyltransferase family 1 protein [Acidimicrobiales bacterium]|nr:glycosyltransferase family 1 protein [Acidimicrobiales bacterium]